MDEKQTYLKVRAQEFQTTLRVLRAYPQDKADLRPHEKSRSARELMSVFGGEEAVLPMLLEGKGFPQERPPQPPDDLKEIIAQFERAHQALTAQVEGMSMEELDKTVPFPTGPKRMGELRKIDLLRTFLLDQVHHRGQLSVYLRMAGAKVPSIYGPTADEPM